MMKLKDFKIWALLFFSLNIFAQTEVKGIVVDANTDEIIPVVQIYNKVQEYTVYGETDGSFKIILNKDDVLVFYALGYEILEQTIADQIDSHYTVKLKPLGEELTEVIIDQQQKKIFGIKSLKSVEGTAIYEGKKTEAVLVDQTIGNKASGNPRQAYNQIVGLNIYETDDAGLQLNIGGRGLDPNRSSNFNTRQNGYDISADVLGYPESYYTPPLEATDEIQIIRGAASLQYGTQFGGLVNFKLKQPKPTKEFDLVTRQGIGSFGLFNSFTSVSGTLDKVSYYTYFQRKQGNGFRPNSNFKSSNVYANLGYQLSDKSKLIFESSYLNYTAQQAGGLTDERFLEDPTYSNRTRNFFDVDWILLNLKLEHDFNSKSKASLNVFRLDAHRKALGYRNARPEFPDILGTPRELLVDQFNNWGAEARFLTKYKIKNKESIWLIGSKLYKSNNFSQQGIGSDGDDANFVFYNDVFTNAALSESEFTFPNLNVSVFTENIIKINSKLSITPGARLEYINTEAEGFYIRKPTDIAGNVLERVLEEEYLNNERTFALLGLGLSYKSSNYIELFANVSQNYRSVTFTDIRVDNPNLIIDENLSDEKGFTADIGLRGSVLDQFRYDLSAYTLLYDNRIGLTQFDASRLIRSNIGTAHIYGLESLITANISNILLKDKTNWHWQHFINTAYTFSEYVDSENDNIVGNEVEFIPKLNFKTGVELGYKNLKSGLQYTYVSTQFTDALNTAQDLTSDFSTVGEIPAYSVMDLSLEYTYKKWKLETGVNNLLDESYFTRRATGYPGPGIIPSNPRNFYFVLQYKI